MISSQAEIGRANKLEERRAGKWYREWWRTKQLGKDLESYRHDNWKELTNIRAGPPAFLNRITQARWKAEIIKAVRKCTEDLWLPFQKERLYDRWIDLRKALVDNIEQCRTLDSRGGVGERMRAVCRGISQLNSKHSKEESWKTGGNSVLNNKRQWIPPPPIEIERKEEQCGRETTVEESKMLKRGGEIMPVNSKFSIEERIGRRKDPIIVLAWAIFGCRRRENFIWRSIVKSLDIREARGGSFSSRWVVLKKGGGMKVNTYSQYRQILQNKRSWVGVEEFSIISEIYQIQIRIFQVGINRGNSNMICKTQIGQGFKRGVDLLDSRGEWELLKVEEEKKCKIEGDKRRDKTAVEWGRVETGKGQSIEDSQIREEVQSSKEKEADSNDIEKRRQRKDIKNKELGEVGEKRVTQIVAKIDSKEDQTEEGGRYDKLRVIGSQILVTKDTNIEKGGKSRGGRQGIEGEKEKGTERYKQGEIEIVRDRFSTVGARAYNSNELVALSNLQREDRVSGVQIEDWIEYEEREGSEIRYEEREGSKIRLEANSIELIDRGELEEYVGASSKKRLDNSRMVDKHRDIVEVRGTLEIRKDDNQKEGEGSRHAIGGKFKRSQGEWIEHLIEDTGIQQEGSRKRRKGEEREETGSIDRGKESTEQRKEYEYAIEGDSNLVECNDHTREVKQPLEHSTELEKEVDSIGGGIAEDKNKGVVQEEKINSKNSQDIDNLEGREIEGVRVVSIEEQEIGIDRFIQQERLNRVGVSSEIYKIFGTKSDRTQRERMIPELETHREIGLGGREEGNDSRSEVSSIVELIDRWKLDKCMEEDSMILEEGKKILEDTEVEGHIPRYISDEEEGGKILEECRQDNIEQVNIEELAAGKRRNDKTVNEEVRQKRESINDEYKGRRVRDSRDRIEGSNKDDGSRRNKQCRDIDKEEEDEIDWVVSKRQRDSTTLELGIHREIKLGGEEEGNDGRSEVSSIVELIDRWKLDKCMEEDSKKIVEENNKTLEDTGIEEDIPKYISVEGEGGQTLEECRQGNIEQGNIEELAVGMRKNVETVKGRVRKKRRSTNAEDKRWKVRDSREGSEKDVRSRKKKQCKDIEIDKVGSSVDETLGESRSTTSSIAALFRDERLEREGKKVGKKEITRRKVWERWKGVIRGEIRRRMQKEKKAEKQEVRVREDRKVVFDYTTKGLSIDEVKILGRGEAFCIVDYKIDEDRSKVDIYQYQRRLRLHEVFRDLDTREEDIDAIGTQTDRGEQAREGQRGRQSRVRTPNTQGRMEGTDVVVRTGREQRGVERGGVLETRVRTSNRVSNRGRRGNTQGWDTINLNRGGEREIGSRTVEGETTERRISRERGGNLITGRENRRVMGEVAGIQRGRHRISNIGSAITPSIRGGGGRRSGRGIGVGLRGREVRERQNTADRHSVSRTRVDTIVNNKVGGRTEVRGGMGSQSGGRSRVSITAGDLDTQNGRVNIEERDRIDLKGGRRLPSMYDPESQNRNLHRYNSCIQEEIMLVLGDKKEKFRDNVTKQERLALKTLKQRIEEKEIIITRADKGSGLVALDYEKYISKGTYYIDEEAKAYSKVQDTEQEIVGRLTKERNKIAEELKDSRVLEMQTATYVKKQLEEKITGIKFYYKIHKDKRIDSMPLRPLQSCIKAPTQHLSIVLTDILQPLLTDRNIPSFIFDSNQLLYRLNKLGRIPSSCTLITSDVSALYPSIPHEAGFRVMREFLQRCTMYNRQQIDSIMKALELVITENYMTWNNQLYKQTSGVAMGTPVAVAYANIFMDWVDREVRNRAPYIHEHIRYIDDNLFILPGDKVEQVIEIANNILPPHIRFTYEKLEAGSGKGLPFLDTQLFIGIDGKIGSRLYTKATDRHAYLLPSSYHPPHVTKNIPLAVFGRLRKICSKEEWFEEDVQQAEEWLENRGYKKSVIKEAIDKSRLKDRWDMIEKIESKRKRDTQRKEEIDVDIPLILTYNQHVGKIRKVLKDRQPLLDSAFNKTRVRPRLSFRRKRNINDMIIQKSLRGPLENNRVEMNVFTRCGETPGYRTRCPCRGLHSQSTCRCCSHSKAEIEGVEGRVHKPVNCNTKNIVYVIGCEQCGKKYVGETQQKLKDRLAQHMYNIDKLNQPLYLHFRHVHKPEKLYIGIVETVRGVEPFMRKVREAWWINQLKTMEPSGFNVKLECNQIYETTG